MYGFVTMLPSGDLLNLANTGNTNNHFPLFILVSISVLDTTQNGCLRVSFFLNGKLRVMRIATSQ